MTMTCDMARKRLNALLDDECPPDEAQQIRAHLETCPDCAADYADLLTTRRAADAWSVEGGEVWAVLRDQLEAPELASVLEELRQLRSEVRSLRVEVAQLRAQAAERASTPSRSPSPLLPYTPTTARELNIA
jgi:anti-sigma factor RsiW